MKDLTMNIRVFLGNSDHMMKTDQFLSLSEEELSRVSTFIVEYNVTDLDACILRINESPSFRPTTMYFVNNQVHSKNVLIIPDSVNLVDFEHYISSELTEDGMKVSFRGLTCLLPEGMSSVRLAYRTRYTKRR